MKDNKLPKVFILFAILILTTIGLIFFQQKVIVKKIKTLGKIVDIHSMRNYDAIMLNNNYITKTFSDNTALITNNPKKFALFIDMNDNSISKIISNIGYYFQQEIPLVLKKLIRKGDNVVHLGGHIGSFENILAESVGENGKVFTFEPNPRSYYVLKRNLNLYNIENIVKAYQFASWSENDEKQLCFPKGYTDIAKISLDSSENNCVNVALRTVDHVLKDEIDHIDLLFMDVEGAEIHSIAGAANLLQNSPDAIILMEWNPKFLRNMKSDPEKFVKDFLAQGKKFFKVIPVDQETVKFEKLSSVEDLMKQKHCDLVIIPNTLDLSRILQYSQ